MADIASNMTMVRWLHAKSDPIIDLTDDYIYAALVARGVTDDETLLCDVPERTRDLCLADIYWGAAVSSVKSGTQGESDGGWTHYVAIKNVVNRDALRKMAEELYDKWGEPYSDPSAAITMTDLY